jgi:hypothetical protein
LVARDPQAAEVLQADLRQAGVRIEATPELLRPEQVPARATAIVWFADDHPSMVVVAAANHLRRQRPGLRIVLVTARPDELTSLLAHATGRVAAVVLRASAAANDILGVLSG